MINTVPENTGPATAPPAHTTVIVRQPQAAPNDYFLFALFVTICCCLPLGIVSLVKSSNVKSRYNAGDSAGAEEASKSAKKWAMAGLITGIILDIIVIIVVVVYYVVLVKTVTTAITTGFGDIDWSTDWSSSSA